MADVPLVTIVNGLPTAGTGTVMTISNIVAALPAALGAGGGLKIDGSGTAVPVTGTMTAVTTVGTITNVVHVDDNAGSITVDGTVTANATLAAETTKVIGTVNLSAAQTLATVTTVSTLTGTTTLTPGTAAANLGKAEDAVHSTGDVGVMALGVRSDTAAALAGTTGDYLPLITNARGAQWVCLEDGAGAQVTMPTLGQQVASLSVPSVQAGFPYETVAASVSTPQAMGATGAAGDYLSHVVVSPGTAGCGIVEIFDNATSLIKFFGGGTTALPSLIPFVIPVGMISTSGAWKIATGANVTCVGVGRFT